MLHFEASVNKAWFGNYVSVSVNGEKPWEFQLPNGRITPMRERVFKERAIDFVAGKIAAK